MKKIKIAFDIDGTLRNDYPPYKRGSTIGIDWNYRICELAIILATMKNTELIIWSGQGKEYAEKVRKIFHAHFNEKPFKSAHGKDEDIKPDIAIDDIHACELGKLNLIVREK